MEKTINSPEWIITDPDCLQCCRETPEFGPGVYQLVQINSYGPEMTSTPFFEVSQGHIYLSDYSKDEELETLAQYGYEPRGSYNEGHEQLSDEDFDRLLAEMYFENEQFEMSRRSCATWDEAVGHIEKLTGFDLAEYKENALQEKKTSLDTVISDAAQRVHKSFENKSEIQEMSR